MINRREFLISTIAVSGVLASSGLIANSVINELSSDDYSSEEAKKILAEYFNKIFYGESLDVNVLPVPGMLSFSESFDIEMNDNKVSVFDIAEIVVEKTKAFNYDASSLCEGKIPTGMKVHKNGIQIETNNKEYVIKLPELKNYDAKIIISNPINVIYEVPVDKWKDVKKFELRKSTELYDSYLGTNNKIRIFKYKSPSNFFITINSLNPLVINEDDTNKTVFFDKKLYSGFHLSFEI